MSGAVDVKSYFQDLLCFLSGRDDLAGFEIQQTEDVAAAVAELIEAADAVWRDTLGATTDGKGERLRAALVRAQGVQ